MEDGKLNSQMTLAEIERSVLSTGQQFQKMLTEAMIEATNQKDDWTKPVCPKCGGKMRVPFKNPIRQKTGLKRWQTHDS